MLPVCSSTSTRLARHALGGLGERRRVRLRARREARGRGRAARRARRSIQLRRESSRAASSGTSRRSGSSTRGRRAGTRRGSARRPSSRRVLTQTLATRSRRLATVLVHDRDLLVGSVESRPVPFDAARSGRFSSAGAHCTRHRSRQPHAVVVVGATARRARGSPRGGCAAGSSRGRRRRQLAEDGVDRGAAEAELAQVRAGEQRAPRRQAPLLTGTSTTTSGFVSPMTASASSCRFSISCFASAAVISLLETPVISTQRASQSVSGSSRSSS